jgi:hypothetical protein
MSWLAPSGMISLLGNRHRPVRGRFLSSRTPSGNWGHILLEQILLELLTSLEAVGERDESLFDTVVRERMGDPIFYGFIKPEPGYVLPDDYGMPEQENRHIKAALGAYIEAARSLAEKLGLGTFHERLAAFQNLAIRTEQKNDYDDFFGWMNPESFDELGNVRS